MNGWHLAVVAIGTACIVLGIAYAGMARRTKDYDLINLGAGWLFFGAMHYSVAWAICVLSR